MDVTKPYTFIGFGAMDVTRPYKFIGVYRVWGHGNVPWVGLILEVLKMIFNFILGPPLPLGIPGEGPDCHYPKAIVGFGPIPARIRKLLIFILALSTPRQ